MKIEEAIKLLQADIADPGSVDIRDLCRAQSLGIEALKQVQQLRVYAKDLFLPLLPDETKD